MLEEMIDKWEETIQSALAPLKKFAQYSAGETGQATGEMFDMKEFARIGKALMDGANELKKIQESFMNTMVRNQLGSMELKKSADAVKELEQIRSDAVAKLTENQSSGIHIFMESGAEYLETLKNSRGVADIVAAQMNMLTKIQDKAKENMLEYVKASDSFATAIKGWTERTMESFSGQADEVPMIPD